MSKNDTSESNSKPEENIEESVQSSDIVLSIEDEKKNTAMLNMIIDLFLNEEQLEKIKVDLKIEDKQLLFIQKVSELVPSLFDDLNDSILEIYKDKMINTDDIPALIVLMKNSYKKFNDNKELSKHVKNITIEDSIHFIKNVLLITIELDYLKVDKKDQVLLIIDICIDLLTSSIDIKTSFIDQLKKCLCC